MQTSLTPSDQSDELEAPQILPDESNDSMESSAVEAATLRFTPARMSNILLYGSLLFIVVLIAWAALTTLDQTVRAQGRVVPTAQVQFVSNLEGGVISEILVKPGQLVAADQPLVRLDNTLAEGEYSVSSSSLASFDARIERLSAEVSGRSPRFAATADPVTREQIDIENQLYRSRQADLNSLTQAYSSRIVQSQKAVAEARANYSAAAAASQSAQEQLAVLRPLVESGVEPRLSLIQAERQATVGASQALAAQATIARVQSSVAEAQAALVQARQDWRSKAATELSLAQAERAGRREAQPALANRLARTVVRSPLAGRVNRVLVSTVGGTARPAEPLVEIVPVRSGLTIEAAVLPKDIAFVRMNQRALVKITAYDYSVYGGLEGRVVNISPDSIADERTGETRYSVRILTEGNSIRSPSGERLPITPGMVAEVNLRGDKRSILSYILTPFTRLKENAFRE